MRRNWLVVVLVLVAMLIVVALPCSAQGIAKKDVGVDVAVTATAVEVNPFIPVGSLVGSLEGGPTIGAALSWNAFELWDMDIFVDLGTKRAESGTDWFAGFSTDACGLLDKLPLLKLTVPLLDRVFPDGTCLGYEYLFDANEPIFILRTPLTNF